MSEIHPDILRVWTWKDENRENKNKTDNLRKSHPECDVDLVWDQLTVTTCIGKYILFYFFPNSLQEDMGILMDICVYSDFYVRMAF